ncbi:MAG: hypothetical protein JWM93_1612 [Frankiales bacterium]|nr:hypothetical protein [Frankiales bacterium]
MDIDELLTRTAPPVTTRTPELTGALRELVPATEHATTVRRGRRGRVAAAGAAMLVVIGIGGAATANGLLPGWFPWTTDSGSSCGLQASVEPRRDGDGALITDRWSAVEQRQALASAREYLGSLDLDSIDRTQAADQWFTYLERISKGNPDRAELESKFQGERLEVHSLLHAVDARLDEYLTARGYDPNSVMTNLASQCAR